MMRIRRGFLVFSHMCGWRDEKMERLWRGEFFLLLLEAHGVDFMRILKIKYA
jgi:hypothetical protein